MKNDISQIQHSKLLKKEFTENNFDIFSHQKINTTIKKAIKTEKKITGKDIFHKTKLKKENNLCLTQNIKFKHDSKRITKTKIIRQNSLIKSPNKALNLSKNNVVKKIFSPKNDECPYNTITSKKYSHNSHNFKTQNEILYMPTYNNINLKEKKRIINNEFDTDRKISKNKILSCNNIHKVLKKDKIIDISDSEDKSLIINNEDEIENEDNQIINTKFPKLASNPFLIDKNSKLNKSDNKFLFSPNLIRKKGRCIQQAQLYYNNNPKSPSNTKTVLSINSSTTQNSNDTINNINAYNLDTSKRKKLNDLNSNINLDGEADNDKNLNIQNNSEEENNYNLLFKNILISIKNGDEKKFLELLEKINEFPKNIINFNFQDKELGNTALHYACQGNNYNIIKWLIQSNCEINIKNNNKQTPLHFASQKGNLDICKILIENGALLNAYDIYNKTPIHYACSCNYLELVKYFYERFIETDIDEKICVSLTNNKQICALFRNYFKNKSKNFQTGKNNKILDLDNNNLKIKSSKNLKNLVPLTTIKKNIIIKKDSENNNKLSKDIQNKSTDKIQKTCLNKIKLNNQNEKKENTNSNIRLDSNSNLSLNTASGIHENELITNLDMYRYKYKKIKTNKQNKIILKEKNNIKKKVLYNPFNQEKENDSLSKNKENDYNKVNKTYDEKNKIGKVKHLQSINNSRKTKNNCIITNQKPESKLNITLEKSQPKINKSLKNIYLEKKSKKDIEYLTEYKNNKKNETNDNINISNNTEKKNLKDYYMLPKKLQLNQTMDSNINMNITSINALNKMSLSLNLIKEEEEKISTKNFICLALLGRGSFGEVYLVQKINTKKTYAMKILRKERIMGQNLSKYALAERNVLSLSHHPFIVKLNYAFQTLTKLFLILEYCPGGDLAKHLSYEKKFEEKRAKFYLCEILLALEDLHKRNIIFRDLKPDNVVLDEDGHCKLTDFGLSKEGIDNDQYTKSFCGSIAYLAPEVLKKQGHGKAVDWYLLGVLLYEMLTGVTPYYDKNKNNLFYNIEQGKLVIPNYVSENAKSLLKGLLQRDPKKRLGGGIRDAEEIKEHKFFEDIDWDKIYQKKIKPPKAMKMNNNMYVFNKPKYFADENNLEEIFGENSLDGWTFINND